ncbi:MAG: hypothetical protein EXR73_07295 [Myxococcales bacterium]|nr:hypothetical protein [Myxococcales bacterium]
MNSLCAPCSSRRSLGLVVGLLLGLLFGFPAPAEAKLFELYAQAQGGAAYGGGVAGVQKDAAFFAAARGGAYGARVGAEFLFVDGWVEHNQHTDGALLGTWTQFMLGIDADFPMGNTPVAKAKLFGELGVAIGFGLGTGQQVMPPLDASELTDRGFLAQLGLGLDYRLAKLVSIGFSVPVTYGYLFKQGVANDEANQYQSVWAAALVHLRLYLEL